MAQVSDKTKGKKQEKNLTVQPIRLLQEAKVVSLQKIIKFRIRVDNVRPLDTQVAGHGSEDRHNKGSSRGMLLHEDGFVLKPVQAPPKGEREVDFYHYISTSPHLIDREFYSYLPRFYGTESMKDDSLVQKQFLILENITQGMTQPCVMDIKVGAKTYGPDATAQKIRQEDSKYLGTKKSLGFSVLGIITYSQEEKRMKRWDKSYGMSLSADNLEEILNIYLVLGINPEASKRIASTFLRRINKIADFFERQDMHHVYASSLLFAFDYRLLQREYSNQSEVESIQFSQSELDALVRLKMIDFAHVFPANGTPDLNFQQGIQNIRMLFSNFCDHN